jgi:hypothetical protein
VLDTGFLLSVASTQVLRPILKRRWAGRAKWPRDVHSELMHRIRSPGGAIPDGLARRALDIGLELAATPIELDDSQRARAVHLAEMLGSEDSTSHAGEAAGAVLARYLGGVLASEDNAAAVVIQAVEGIETLTLRILLKRLHQLGELSEADVDRVLEDLRNHGRPNVAQLRATDVLAT